MNNKKLAVLTFKSSGMKIEFQKNKISAFLKKGKYVKTKSLPV